MNDPLVFSDKDFRTKLSALFAKQRAQLGISLKEVARRWGVAWSVYYKIYSAQNESSTFAVLFKLCEVHQLPLVLTMGSNLDNVLTYEIVYTGDDALFRKQFAEIFVQARNNIGITTRDVHERSGAGFSWVTKVENGKIGPKPESIHNVFLNAFGAKMIIKVEISNAQ